MKHERCHRCGKSIRDDCCTWGCEGPSLREAAQDSARALAALREDELARLRTALAQAQAREAALREAYERDERVQCRACNACGYTTVPLPFDDKNTETCGVCVGRGAVRAPLPDPSREVAALLADAAFGRECRSGKVAR